jgi:hypothetical protein
VTGDAHRAGKFCKLRHTIRVDPSIRVEDPENHTIGAKIFSQLYILFHDLKFPGVVTEIRTTRADHHEQCDVKMLPGKSDRTCTGSASALNHIFAQFHAVGAAFLRLDG